MYCLAQYDEPKRRDGDEELRHDRGGNALTIHTSDGLEFDIAAAVYFKKDYPNFKRLPKAVNVARYSATEGGSSMLNLDIR